MKTRKFALLIAVLLVFAMVMTGCSETEEYCHSCKGSARCYNCNGTGFCELCYGEGRYYEPLTDRYERCYCSNGRCTVCFGNGVCKWCKGLGIE